MRKLMMDWKLIEPWEYIVVHVASEYHRKFKFLELEDIRQTLYEWFPGHINKFMEWNEIGGKEAKNLIYRSLRNYALDYCQYQKAKSLGYDVSDLYYYDPVIVEALLPAVLRSEWGVTHKLNLGRPGRPSVPSEGGNLQAMMIEVDSAYHKLSTEEKQLLFLRYAESMEYADIAKELELISPDATRMRTTRVVRKLVKLMGGMKPWLDLDTTDKASDSPSESVSTEDNEEQYASTDEGEEETL
jgi:RNA polymerase sigma factor (sigma-70 family)